MMTDKKRLIEILTDDYCPLLYMQGDVGNLADYLISNGVTIQKWIPVTERLPESGKIVLIYQVNGWVSEGSYSTYDKKWRRFRWGSCYIDVTHWMPLPEAPKED